MMPVSQWRRRIDIQANASLTRSGVIGVWRSRLPVKAAINCDLDRNAFGCGRPRPYTMLLSVCATHPQLCALISPVARFMEMSAMQQVRVIDESKTSTASAIGPIALALK